MNEVAATRIEAMREQVQTEMRRQDPRIEMGDISTRGGRLSFLLRDPTQVDAARERLLAITGGGVGMTGQREWDLQVVDTSRIVLTPTQAGLTQAVDTAMGDATEVVRRRIDELGTREPTIIRQGSNRIVVQVPGLQNLPPSLVVFVVFLMTTILTEIVSNNAVAVIMTPLAIGLSLIHI